MHELHSFCIEEAFLYSEHVGLVFVHEILLAGLCYWGSPAVPLFSTPHVCYTIQFNEIYVSSRQQISLEPSYEPEYS